MWPYLCGSTVSLKFRQFNLAVCDPLGCLVIYGVYRGCDLFGGYRGAGVVNFNLLKA